MPPALRRLHAVLIWTLALILVGLPLANQLQPGGALVFADGAVPAMRAILLTGAVVFGLMLFFWPPTVPWLGRSWRRMRTRAGVDRGPMLQALQDLQHFESADKHATIGRILVQAGELPKALPHLARALELEPDQLGPRFLLGRSLRALGAPDRAAPELAKVVAQDPDHGFGDAQRELALAYLELGRPKDALQHLYADSRAHGISPFNAYWCGRAMRLLGEKDHAEKAFRQAIDHQPAAGAPKDPDARYWQAMARVARWLPQPAGSTPAREGDT